MYLPPSPPSLVNHSTSPSVRTPIGLFSCGHRQIPIFCHFLPLFPFFSPCTEPVTSSYRTLTHPPSLPLPPNSPPTRPLTILPFPLFFVRSTSQTKVLLPHIPLRFFPFLLSSFTHSSRPSPSILTPTTISDLPEPAISTYFAPGRLNLRSKTTHPDRLSFSVVSLLDR